MSLHVLAQSISDHLEFMKGRYARLSDPCQMLRFIVHSARMLVHFCSNLLDLAALPMTATRNAYTSAKERTN